MRRAAGRSSTAADVASASNGADIAAPSSARVDSLDASMASRATSETRKWGDEAGTDPAIAAPSAAVASVHSEGGGGGGGGASALGGDAPPRLTAEAVARADDANVAAHSRTNVESETTRAPIARRRSTNVAAHARTAETAADSAGEERRGGGGGGVERVQRQPQRPRRRDDVDTAPGVPVSPRDSSRGRV